MYTLEYTLTAEESFKKLKKNEPQAFAKLKKLVLELMERAMVQKNNEKT